MAFVRLPETAMSKVYSFRLDDDNPREIRAREVINAWILKGYTLRYIIIEALTTFNERNRSDEDAHDLIEKIRFIVDESSKEKAGKDQKNATEYLRPLSPAFVSELGKSIKTGIRIG